jgi:hypothetical protein
MKETQEKTENQNNLIISIAARGGLQIIICNKIRGAV